MVRERWRPIFDGTFEVSDLGRVRRARPPLRGRAYVGQLIKLGVTKKGYHRVDLVINRKRKQVFVHVLVAEAFIGPKPKNKEVNHKDFVRTNNRPKNLEYKTHLQNVRHGARAGHYKWHGRRKNGR